MDEKEEETKAWNAWLCWLQDNVPESEPLLEAIMNQDEVGFRYALALLPAALKRVPDGIMVKMPMPPVDLKLR
jgi:hypothetical protein